MEAPGLAADREVHDALHDKAGLLMWVRVLRYFSVRRNVDEAQHYLIAPGGPQVDARHQFLAVHLVHAVEVRHDFLPA